MPTSTQVSGKELTPTADYVIKRRQIANGDDFRHRMLLFSHDFFSPWRHNPQFARVSSLPRFQDHTHTHHTRQYSSGRVISPTQKPLRDNTRHSQETDTSIPRDGIRTRNPSKRAAIGISVLSYLSLQSQAFFTRK